MPAGPDSLSGDPSMSGGWPGDSSRRDDVSAERASGGRRTVFARVPSITGPLAARVPQPHRGCTPVLSARTLTVEAELRALFEKHRLAFDERYVWD